MWSVVGKEARTTEPVYIYTDSYAAFKGCTEWLPFWEQNQWEHLLEWLHVKRGHSGSKDLYKEAISRGWAVTRDLRNTVISACGQCRVRLEKYNPLKEQPLTFKDKQGFMANVAN